MSYLRAKIIKSNHNWFSKKDKKTNLNKRNISVFFVALLFTIVAQFLLVRENSTNSYYFNGHYYSRIVASSSFQQFNTYNTDSIFNLISINLFESSVRQAKLNSLRAVQSKNDLSAVLIEDSFCYSSCSENLNLKIDSYITGDYVVPQAVDLSGKWINIESSSSDTFCWVKKETISMFLNNIEVHPYSLSKNELPATNCKTNNLVSSSTSIPIPTTSASLIEPEIPQNISVGSPTPVISSTSSLISPNTASLFETKIPQSNSPTVSPKPIFTFDKDPDEDENPNENASGEIKSGELHVENLKKPLFEFSWPTETRPAAFGRLKHDYQWMDWPSRAANPDWPRGFHLNWYPETVPLWVNPKSGDGKIKYSLEWLIFLRELQPNRNAASWITRIAAGLFNKKNEEIPIFDLLAIEDLPKAEGISSGGNVINILEIQGKSVRIEMIYFRDEVPDPSIINFANTPWLVTKFTSVSLAGEMGNAGGIDVYFPNLSSQKSGYWVDLARVEIFPELPFRAKLNTDLQVYEFPDVRSKKIEEFNNNSNVTVIEYYPRAGNVWGRVTTGWLLLQYQINGHPEFNSNWIMETRPPLNSRE